MKSHMRLLLAVLRKDLRLFWPLAVLTAALRVASQILPGIDQIAVGGLMAIVIPLTTALLVLMVVHEDAVVSFNHDWLTRPIPGTTLLAAKTLFLVLALFVPSILGSAGYNLSQGRSLGESLLTGIDSGASSTQLLTVMVLMAFSSITTGFRLAILAALMIMAGIWAAGRLVGMPDRGFPQITGSEWVVTDSARLLLALGAGLVLWIQYRYRRTGVARGIAAAAPAAALAVLLTMPWSGVFAIQKRTSSDPASASLVDVTLADGCFPVRALDGAGNARYGGEHITLESYDAPLLRRAGTGALAFSTPLIVRSVPQGLWLRVDHVDLTYRAGSRVVAQSPPPLQMYGAAGEHGALVGSQWLLGKGQQQQLAAIPGIESHFVYSLSLLAPVASATLAPGAARSYAPGIGYCSVTKVQSLLTVDCFKPGIQPAQLIAVVEGANEGPADFLSRRKDFTPGALELWGGQHYQMMLSARGVPAPRVRLTAYEARAHFDREIDVPGVLGGPLSTCPIFPVPAATP